MTEQADEAVTVWFCIRKMLRSNLGRDASYPDWGFPWMSSLPPDKRRESTSRRPQSLPSKSFPIQRSFYRRVLSSRMPPSSGSKNKRSKVALPPAPCCVYWQGRRIAQKKEHTQGYRASCSYKKQVSHKSPALEQHSEDSCPQQFSGN
jgi:hypothetical protein